MRHQNWKARILENFAGCPSQNELPQARMAIAAHHEEVRLVGQGFMLERLANRALAQLDLLETRIQPLACKRGFDAGAVHARLEPLFTADDCKNYLFGEAVIDHGISPIARSSGAATRAAAVRIGRAKKFCFMVFFLSGSGGVNSRGG